MTPTDHWAAVAQRLGTDLFLDLQPDPTLSAHGRGAQLRRSLTSELRTAISDGRLPAGTRLPPYRSLAADLGVARGTVSAAYSELIAEGWLTARQGSGTVVAHTSTPSAPVTARHKPSGPTHDFSLGAPTSSLFPRSDWIAATRVAVTEAPHSAFGPGDPQGNYELREELSRYLARVRGVRTTPDNIVLTTSVHTALVSLCGRAFDGALAVESFSLPFHRASIEAAGTLTLPIPIDDNGADVGALTSDAYGDAKAVLLTPSHQFPTGVALSPARRAAVVADIRSRGGYIIEDDYDGELRYDREPIGAVQGLAPDSVIYTGSVSKSLSPAVRIAWLVVPDAVVEPLVAAKGPREPDASIIDQLVLAQLIRTGAYDRHIRRSRQFYRKRRDHLVARLRDVGVDAGGVSAGLHIVLPCRPDAEESILAAAWSAGFLVFGLGQFRHPAASPDGRGGIVVGFGSPTDSNFAADVDALANLLARFR
ncbi:putative GntR family transcriptional regulator [Gordonia effusa NBRC 100432]|uniref:Putative GntR family transcriptional regulator n=1 Tax=Gordonia effusa NBRC 100432 TaxID=1077974 RepID=H0R5Y0_9ACTN|nr:PLP-dependent aminotransferase family protein [Gordonia effusa]GAB20481.1 putative GntR family transcriptional regulator [Gordonia effusa NBRC 100432]